MGRIYQQTFVDTYSKVAFAKLYTTKTPITSADILNDKVLPFFEHHKLPMLRILTDRGTEYCGKVEQHDYQLYLAIRPGVYVAPVFSQLYGILLVHNDLNFYFLDLKLAKICCS